MSEFFFTSIQQRCLLKLHKQYLCNCWKHSCGDNLTHSYPICIARKDNTQVLLVPAVHLSPEVITGRMLFAKHFSIISNTFKNNFPLRKQLPNKPFGCLHRLLFCQFLLKFPFLGLFLPNRAIFRHGE